MVQGIDFKAANIAVLKKAKWSGLKVMAGFMAVLIIVLGFQSFVSYITGYDPPSFIIFPLIAIYFFARKVTAMKALNT